MNPVDWAAWLHGKFFAQAVVGAGYLLAAIVGAIVGAGFFVLVWAKGVDQHRTEQAEREPQVIYKPIEDDPYRVGPNKPTFRIDTLDADLNKAGLMRGHPFDGLSPPQAKPTPENDTNPAEYFLLKNGLYLRATRPKDGTITGAQREKARAVILAHEARLKH